MAEKRQENYMQILKERRDDTFINDVDLARLIQETEENGMISAPWYLKESILNKSNQAGNKLVVKKNQFSANLQLTLYGIKITAAMVGAIGLLVVMNPNTSLSKPRSSAPKNPSVKITSVLYEQSNALSSALNHFSNNLFQWR